MLERAPTVYERDLQDRHNKQLYNFCRLVVSPIILPRQRSIPTALPFSLLPRMNFGRVADIPGRNDEVAQYLTTFKSYEHKGDETLKEPIHQSYSEQFFHVMTSGKKVNKTDATNIASQFGVSD